MIQQEPGYIKNNDMEEQEDLIEVLQHNAMFIDKLSRVIKTDEDQLRRQRELLLLMQEKNDLLKQQNEQLKEENERLKKLLFNTN
jgi:hypothetical protein